jgi:polysaccharide chain length determinant protein (PEP-CTERM system associated)
VLPGKIYTPEVVFEAALRRRWLILSPFLAILAGVAVYAHSLPNIYRSETLVLVIPQRIPDNYVRSTVTTSIADRLRTIREQLLSRTRLEQLINEFNLYPNERARLPMEEVVERMRPNVFLDTVRGDSFRIAFIMAEDAETPAKVATRLAEMFIEEGERDRTAIADETNVFLQSQLDDAKAQLEEHERKLEEFRKANAGSLPSQFQSNLQVIQATQNQMQTLAESISRDRDRRLLWEKSLSEIKTTERPESVVATPSGADAVTTPNTLVDELELARAQLRALEQRLRPTHPDVTAKARQIRTLETQLAIAAADAGAAPATGPPTNGAAGTSRPVTSNELIRLNRTRQIQTEIDKVDAQIATKEKETARLQAIVDDYQKRVEVIPTRETEMTQLMRDYDTVQRLYTGLLEKREASKIAANLERQQVGEQYKILDKARPAEVPFSPNRPRMILMGAVAGLFLGIGLGVYLEYRDSSLRSEEDVLSFLSLPVLAVIPFMESPRDRRLRRLRVALTSALGLVAIAGTVAAVSGTTDFLAWFR